MHDESSTQKWLSSLEDGVGFKVWDSTIDLEFGNDPSQSLTGDFGMELSTLTPLPSKAHETKIATFSLEEELAQASAAVESAIAAEEALQAAQEIEQAVQQQPWVPANQEQISFEPPPPEPVAPPPTVPTPAAAKPKREKPVIDNQYQVASELGKGVMCTVYKVKDLSTNTMMIMKMLPKEAWNNQAIVERAKNELQIITNLQNDHLVPFRSFGATSTGQPYILMDYLQAITLLRAIKASDGLPLPRVVQVFTQLCQGLSACHGAGVLHRDIRPENIMFLSKKGDFNLKLVDFGLAKLISEGIEPMKQLEATGEIFGNPPYMSPEECRGERLDARSDIYSLGCVMYFAMTGQPPFAGSNSPDTLKKQIKETLPAPSKVRANIASTTRAGWVTVTDLEYIVMRCLEKNPNDRYQSVEEILADIDKLRKQIPLQQIQPKAASGLRTVQVAAPKQEKNMVGPIIGVAIVVAIAAAAGAFFFLVPH